MSFASPLTFVLSPKCLPAGRHGGRGEVGIESERLGRTAPTRNEVRGTSYLVILIQSVSL